MADPITDRVLLVLRHAKAARPETFEGPDFDRPLAKRGRADAETAGRWLADQGLIPDLVLCSTAVRALQTWESVAAGGVAAADVWPDRRIYDAGVDDLLEVLRETPPQARTVLLVGHGPGVPWLVTALAPAGSAAHERLSQSYPTSGLAVLRHSSRWSELDTGAARLADFVVPRG